MKWPVSGYNTPAQAFSFDDKEDQSMINSLWIMLILNTLAAVLINVPFLKWSMHEMQYRRQTFTKVFRWFYFSHIL